MTDSPAVRPSRITKIALALVVLYVVVAGAMALSARPYEPVGDSVGYDATALRMLETGRFYYSNVYGADIGGDFANAYTMPGYSAFLALIYLVAGTGAGRFLAVQLVQVAVVAGILWMVFALGRRLVSEKTGLLSLCLAGVWWPIFALWYPLLSEALYTLVLMGVVWLWLDVLDRPTVRSGALLGIVAGASLYLRPSISVWLVIVGLAAVAIRRGDRARVFRSLLVTALVMTVAMVPWWVRSERIYDEVVIFNTTSAHPRLFGLLFDYDRPLAESPEVAALSAELNSETPREGVDLLLGEELEGEVDELIDEYDDKPREWLGRRLGIFLGQLFLPADPMTAFRPPPGPAMILYQRALMVLGFLGAACSLRRKHIWSVASLPLYWVVLHALTLPLTRYNVPVLPLVAVFAAALVGAVYRRMRARKLWDTTSSKSKPDNGPASRRTFCTESTESPH